MRSAATGPHLAGDAGPVADAGSDPRAAGQPRQANPLFLSVALTEAARLGSTGLTVEEWLGRLPVKESAASVAAAVRGTAAPAGGGVRPRAGADHAGPAGPCPPRPVGRRAARTDGRLPAQRPAVRPAAWLGRTCGTGADSWRFPSRCCARRSSVVICMRPEPGANAS